MVPELDVLLIWWC